MFFLKNVIQLSKTYFSSLENVALRGVAFQSSSRMKTTGQASRVIDGRRFSMCSITKDEPGQWVKVDLLVPYKVTVIQLAYSEDCCYSDEVWVDHTWYIYDRTRLKECIAHYV